VDRRDVPLRGSKVGLYPGWNGSSPDGVGRLALVLFGGSPLVTFAYAATLGICMAFIVAASVATMAPTRGELEALEQP